MVKSQYVSLVFRLFLFPIRYHRRNANPSGGRHLCNWGRHKDVFGGIRVVWEAWRCHKYQSHEIHGLVSSIESRFVIEKSVLCLSSLKDLKSAGHLLSKGQRDRNLNSTW